MSARDIPNIEDDESDEQDPAVSLFDELEDQPSKATAPERDELDELLYEATAELRANAALKRRKADIARLPAAQREQAERELASFMEAKQWTAITNVALFWRHKCASCGEEHTMFQGWFRESAHKTDPHAKKMQRGKAIEALPERVDVEDKEPAEMCFHCVGTIINLRRFFNGYADRTR